ncbi:ABC transporter permease subunit [Mesorhizobium sp. M3A.F.Ca.ET.174.01.1.1]|uniref:ABC transporter permease subunit n=1 Tax=unclassified Mesorhizobium TaxID=325217 RepID=UPI00109411EC|nr:MULTISPECIES: ABC transporter permease subunit [unclassified Mesorhizobium]TGS85038.1 ABC transporter permease subunit [Mesorhizobium sp. M3A.F.Ca.ET.175.01.1.1]TGT23026.1 ABC transporter permease subunit [Mesorhizobium sp. M3A.F.Ca.ET.174.01.1.1]
MQATSTTPGSAAKAPWRSHAAPVAAAVAILGLVVVLVTVGQHKLQQIGLGVGFDYLFATAGFSISQSVIPLLPGSTNLAAIGVGLANALVVALTAVVGSTLLGLVAALARLSSNPLAARIGRLYVNVVRNVPLIIFLVFLYRALLQLPPPRSAPATFGAIYFTNRGIVVPSLEFSTPWLFVGVLLAVAGLAAWHMKSRLWLVPILACSAVAVILGTAQYQTPALAGFSIKGGFTFSNEFGALAFGIAFYFGAEMGEVIRAAILSVPRPQSEAAAALGLRRGQAFRLVIAPQALRLAIPPTINVYVNIIKSTPLGVTVGYPEIMSVTYQIMQNTGRAIESVVTLAFVFMAINAACSLLVNSLDRRRRYEAAT